MAKSCYQWVDGCKTVSLYTEKILHSYWANSLTTGDVTAKHVEKVLPQRLTFGDKTQRLYDRVFQEWQENFYKRKSIKMILAYFMNTVDHHSENEEFKRNYVRQLVLFMSIIPSGASWVKIVELANIVRALVRWCAQYKSVKVVADVIFWSIEFFRLNGLDDWIDEQGGWCSLLEQPMLAPAVTDESSYLYMRSKFSEEIQIFIQKMFSDSRCSSPIQYPEESFSYSAEESLSESADDDVDDESNKTYEEDSCDYFESCDETDTSQMDQSSTCDDTDTLRMDQSSACDDTDTLQMDQSSACADTDTDTDTLRMDQSSTCDGADALQIDQSSACDGTDALQQKQAPAEFYREQYAPTTLNPQHCSPRIPPPSYEYAFAENNQEVLDMPWSTNKNEQNTNFEQRPHLVCQPENYPASETVECDSSTLVASSVASENNADLLSEESCAEELESCTEDLEIKITKLDLDTNKASQQQTQMQEECGQGYKSFFLSNLSAEIEELWSGTKRQPGYSCVTQKPRLPLKLNPVPKLCTHIQDQLYMDRWV